MKFHKLLVALLVLSLGLGVQLTAFAQDEVPEMTEEEWQKQMDENTAMKADLMGRLDQLSKDIDNLKKQNTEKDAAVVKAEEDLYASVGSTKSDVAQFRANFEKVEKALKDKKESKEDVQKAYDLLSLNKARCLPEFYERWKKMKAALDAWGPEKKAGYTVVKGDCLYKIAGKKEIYNNVKMWPVLWEANEKGVISAPPRVPKTIKNPHWIYPGQVLTVPALTADLQKKAEDKAKKYRYTRKKRVTTSTTTTDTKKDVKKDEKKDVKKEVKKEEPKKEVKKEEPKKK